MGSSRVCAHEFKVRHNRRHRTEEDGDRGRCGGRVVMMHGELSSMRFATVRGISRACARGGLAREDGERR
jgi:hypothetical protein